MGDFNGVGTEVVLKALTDPEFRNSFRPVLIGSFTVFEKTFKLLVVKGNLLGFKLQRVESPGEISSDPEIVGVLDRVPVREEWIALGKVSEHAGRAALQALKIGAELCLGGSADGLVTAPLSKLAMHRSGYHFPGQTEFLAELAGTRVFAMMFLNGSFRIGLVTTHLPLAAVATQLTKRKVTEKTNVIHKALTEVFWIPHPRIGVCALNPHAGEGGKFGKEESKIISPAIEEMRAGGMDVRGPYPADSLFARWSDYGLDAAVAMYHDQGLIPVKLYSSLGGSFGVNFTAGLPFIRTSPDHGTAFDIAGKGVADEGSMKEAIQTAIRLARTSNK